MYIPQSYIDVKTSDYSATCTSSILPRMAAMAPAIADQ
jgi:hypothetical protein